MSQIEQFILIQVISKVLLGEILKQVCNLEFYIQDSFFKILISLCIENVCRSLDELDVG